MLEVSGLESAYGDSQILFGVGFSVGTGEVVTLLGRNGMGKTTTVKSIFGLLKPRAGRIAVDGVDVTGRPPHAVARLGLGLVPEGTSSRPPVRPKARTPGRSIASTASFPASPSGGGTAATSFRAASSRCSRSAAH